MQQKSQPPKIEVRIRPLKSDDIPFVMDSWLSSLRSSVRDLPDDLFFPTYRKLCVRILAKAQIRVLEAVNGGEIVGYSICDDASGTLHWVYVKSAYRAEGYSKLLTEHLPSPLKHTFRTTKARYTLKLGEFVPGELRHLRESDTNG